MFKHLTFFSLILLAIIGNVLSKKESKGASLKPMSVCCDIPELGDPVHLATCSNPKLAGPCNDVHCVFGNSGFLIDRNTLNNEVYRNYLRQWAEKHKEWEAAVEKAITDCVDKETRQHLDYPCKAYDVFTCTGIAMLKKCPESAWRC